MITPAERIANYEKVTGWTKSLFLGPRDQIVGMWEMGADYTVKSGFYGGYPAGYIRRINALYPETPKTLHLFAGRVDTTICPGDTVDIDFDLMPTFIDNAETLSKVPLGNYMRCMADPPYSEEDAVHYGSPMVNRNKVIRALTGLPAGAHVIWLDQAKPMYRKEDWLVYAQIGMSKSTNHRYRQILIFERKPHLDTHGL